MAEKPRKPRPNEMATDLSDAPSCGVKNAKRTRGRRRTMIVGYARTSTTDQAAGLAAQEDLKVAGAERIFGEQSSSQILPVLQNELGLRQLRYLPSLATTAVPVNLRVAQGHQP